VLLLVVVVVVGGGVVVVVVIVVDGVAVLNYKPNVAKTWSKIFFQNFSSGFALFVSSRFEIGTSWFRSFTVTRLQFVSNKDEHDDELGGSEEEAEDVEEKEKAKRQP
jgi:hypothetical protein